MIKRKKWKKIGATFAIAAALILGGCGAVEESEANSLTTQDSEAEGVVLQDNATDGEVEKPDNSQNMTSEENIATADGSTTDASTVDASATDASLEASMNGEDGAKPEGDYIELALNVYYNDGDHDYYANESGSSIYVTEEGQYTLSFDCEQDLSQEAKALGVNALQNLTAIYILDMGAGAGAQSALSSCDILFNEIKVDGKNLTITQTKPKTAFKSNGIFDTNDPINAWDGSVVEEVVATQEHVANFTTVSNPTKVEVCFTLSGMIWGEQADSAASADTKQEAELSSKKDQVNGADFEKLDFESMSSRELVYYMGNGINLGNTFEAYGHATLGSGAKVKAYETYWGQPETTAEMFVGMKNSGFDSVRIPVAWTNMMDYENGDYVISDAYLDRVEQVVSYALDAGLFVVINDHWDGGWWAMFGSKSPETVDKAWTMYKSIWTQVAERFKDTSEMLIFESANEELGNSLNDNSNWEDSGSLSKDQCYEMTNEINQAFVDLVRSTGGNNAHRFLLIAGYNTDIDLTVDARFEMPKDTAENKLILSVHYYTPWNYCGAQKQAKWGLKKDYEEMNRQFAKLERFTKSGYGIIIGEYAALPIYNSDNDIEFKENTVAFTSNLLDNCDLYNYCPMLWSCNDFYNKKTCSMRDEKIGELFWTRRFENEEGNAASETELANQISTRMEQEIEEAPEVWEGVKKVSAGAPIAWIMWNGGAGTYSVGDTYNPSDNTQGIVATDTMIYGPGEYTVSLDFEEGNDGLTFAALAIANGESIFSKPTIKIKEISLDGEVIELIAEPYTTSDDGICTRVNLLNEWVSKVPQDARSVSGDLANASATIIDKSRMVGIKNITITFELL